MNASHRHARYVSRPRPTCGPHPTCVSLTLGPRDVDGRRGAYLERSRSPGPQQSPPRCRQAGRPPRAPLLQPHVASPRDGRVSIDSANVRHATSSTPRRSSEEEVNGRGDLCDFGNRSMRIRECESSAHGCSPFSSDHVNAGQYQATRNMEICRMGWPVVAGEYTTPLYALEWSIL